MGMVESDVRVGVVNSFMGSEIKAADDIVELPRKNGQTSELPDGSRPFVCVGVQDGRSQWAELTKQSGNALAYLMLEYSWRSWQDGDDSHNLTKGWKPTPSYINGAVFEGPNTTFADLATNINTSGYLKIVTGEGIEAIREHLNNNVLENPLFE